MGFTLKILRLKKISVLFFLCGITVFSLYRWDMFPVFPVGCTPVNVTLSSKPLPLTALVSFPGSGNTWVRHIVQQATGLATGSVYCDIALRDNGFPYECTRNSSVVLIKTHKTNIHEPGLHVSRIVLLLRNPFDAIRAEFHRLCSGNHTGMASDISVEQYWPRMSRILTFTWRRNILAWANFKGPIHVTKYEDWKANVDHELRRLLRFLGISASRRGLSCAVANSEGEFHRKAIDRRSLEFDQTTHNLLTAQIRFVARYRNITL